MDPYTGREIIKLCSKCFIQLKNEADLQYHEYIVHGNKPAEKPTDSDEQEDRVLSKSEITAIRRCITRAEKGISPLFKITLVDLVCKDDEEGSEEGTISDEDDSAEEADGENSSENSSNENSEEGSEESSEESEEPIRKQALAFLREMMKAVVSNQFELKRNMFIDIVDSLE